MKNNAKRLLTGVTAAVMSLSAVSAADIAVLGSAISAFAEDGVAINEANFPDEVFRNYISENYDVDSNGVLSDSEIEEAKVFLLDSMEISDLKGIEYFTSLIKLFTNKNQLTSLDLSKNTALERLECNYNQLMSLDLSNNTALTSLWCDHNQLTSLDISKNAALSGLYCYDNQLTSLDLGNKSELKFLYCGQNQLTALDVSNNAN